MYKAIWYVDCGGTQVQLWCNRFKEGREDVNDNARLDRPSTWTIDENIEAVKKIILDNRRITITEVADDVGISFQSFCLKSAERQSPKKYFRSLFAFFSRILKYPGVHYFSPSTLRINDLFFTKYFFDAGGTTTAATGENDRDFNIKSQNVFEMLFKLACKNFSANLTIKIF